MSSTEPLVYLRGKLTPASQASLAIYDAGIVLGATVTDLVRTFHGELWRLEEHVRRFYRALKYTRIPVEVTQADWMEISHELVRHNRALLHPEDELCLVYFATPGELPVYAGAAGAAKGGGPTLCAHTFPLPFELWTEKFETGQHLITPSIRHVPPQCYDPKMKYRSRMHYYLADHEARLVDPAASALLLDLDGNVTETSGANFLIVSEGTIISPTLRNTLPGVSRQMIRELCAGLGLPFVERDFQVFDVLNADEAFTASTPYCILPVTKVNGLPIGDGTVGPIFRLLLERWSAAIGVDVREQFRAGAARRTAGIH